MKNTYCGTTPTLKFLAPFGAIELRPALLTVSVKVEHGGMSFNDMSIVDVGTRTLPLGELGKNSTTKAALSVPTSLVLRF
jgi:hypothetical protein